MRDLRGKRAIVTGGAAGIGRALAQALAAEGAQVIVADIDVGAAEGLAEQLCSEGRSASAIEIDVASEASIAAARETLMAGPGPPDLLVNNAGIVCGGDFETVPMGQHQRTLAVNLAGLMAMTHAFLPDLTRRPEAHIVNIVSASAFLALPFATSYAASKWGALGFSESLRHELMARGHHHVKVTAICPAYVDTGLFAGAKAPAFTRFLTPEALAEATVRAIGRDTAIVRIPWSVHVTRLAAVMPTRAFDVVARLFGLDASMRHWTGRK